MSKVSWGKVLITFVIVSSTTISVVVDWNQTHIYNADWPGHAVYHGLLFLNLLIGVSVLSLWLMWRTSKEPDLGVTIAVIVLLIYRGSFFYVGLIVEEANPLPGNEEVPHVAGIPVYANVVASGLFILLTLIGYRIHQRAEVKVQQ